MAPKKRRIRTVHLKPLKPKKVKKVGKGKELVTRYMVDIPKTMGGTRQRFFFESITGANDFIAEKTRLTAKVGQAAFAETGGRSVQEAIEEFLPRLSERSKSHRGNAERVLNPFSERHGPQSVTAISPIILDEWLRRRSNENTRARDFRYLRMFFNWAYRMEIIEKNPVDRLETPKSTPSRVIMTPDQMAKLLAEPMEDWLRSSILLGGFAGLRTEEMIRMDWSAIDFKEQEIHVAPGVQKDSGGWRERYVAFTEPLKALLVKGEGAIIPVKKTPMFERRRKLAKKLGWDGWPDNALRHSFASYHLARYGDAAKTAHQMGHTSSAMVYRTYARAVRKSVAEKWWSLWTREEFDEWMWESFWDKYQMAKKTILFHAAA
jgi:integrase